MKGVLLLNGKPCKKVKIHDGDYVVCADGAYSWAKKIGIIPQIVMGDFDSLHEVPTNCEVLTFSPIKNETDGEIAVRYMMKRGCDEIDIYGGFGKRTDHFLGNVALLKIAFDNKTRATLLSENERISFVTGKVEFKPKKKGTISIVPFGKCAHIMDSEGLKYALTDLILTNGDTRGISNVASGDIVKFNVVEGEALVLESWRKE